MNVLGRRTRNIASQITSNRWLSMIEASCIFPDLVTSAKLLSKNNMLYIKYYRLYSRVFSNVFMKIHACKKQVKNIDNLIKCFHVCYHLFAISKNPKSQND